MPLMKKGTAAKPAAKPAVKPAAKPAATKPTAKPAATKPAAKAPTKSVASKPVAKKPAAAPAKPATKSAAKPSAKPAAKPVTAKPSVKAAAKPVAKAPAKKPATATGVRPLAEVLSKTGLIQHLAEDTGVELKAVKLVYASLENAMLGAVHKKGARTFMFPGFFKVLVIDVPAKPKRKGINPFTGEEQMFKAKPATVKLKIRPMKKLKDGAL
jgi:nucleoid DNA-binding protein